MQVKVAVIGGAADGLAVSLTDLPVTLGREGDSSIPINDRWASRHHCQLFDRSGELHVRDLASKHGTIVNGSPIDECRLQQGDRVMVGLTAMVIQQIDTRGEEFDTLVDRESGVSAS